MRLPKSPCVDILMTFALGDNSLCPFKPKIYISDPVRPVKIKAICDAT